MAYTLTGQRGGTVRFEPFESGLVEKESESYSSTVTKNPIEAGSDINDHLNNASGTLSISGVIIGGDSAIAALKEMRESRDIMTYTGVTRMKDLVFTSLKFDRTYKNKDGAFFSATLKQVKIVAAEYAPSDTGVPMTTQDAGKSTDAQLSKTSNAGMTIVSLQPVSSTGAEKHAASYTTTSSPAPLTRVTGGYDGLSQ